MSTPSCFDHISLIRTWNGGPCFFGLRILQGTFYKNLIIFLNRMDWLASGSLVSRASLCGALFFMILEPKTYLVRAHKLQLDLGHYCGSILGLGLSYMQPTMNPYGYLVVKQAENLRYSACMENEEKS